VIDSIDPFPKIPLVLHDAALRRLIVPFIGAGVSQLGGCPGWSEFANAALNFFVEKEKMNPAQFDQISSLSSRIKLSLVQELEAKHDINVDFNDLLKPSDSKQKQGDRVYANLAKLASTFVTTNYDTWLHNSLPSSSVADNHDFSKEVPVTSRIFFDKKSDIIVEKLNVPNAVFHLHCSVLNRDSMVFTTTQYLERYSSHRIDGAQNHENPFLTFLETLFKTKNVLFIGYGLNELEVLEYVIQKGVISKSDSDEEPRHYVLHGFFSHEIELARSLESYYKQFGIGLLVFSRDEHDWDQLAEVIEYLVSNIPPGPGLALDVRSEMEGLLP